jgi:hypothetical protein
VHATNAIIAETLNCTGRTYYLGSASLFNFKKKNARLSGLLANNSGILNSLCRRTSFGGCKYGSRAPGDGSFVFACKENPSGGDFPMAALEAVAISFSEKYPTTMVEREIVTQTHVLGLLGPMNPRQFSTGGTTNMEKHGSVLYVVPSRGDLSPADCLVVLDDYRRRGKKVQKLA